MAKSSPQESVPTAKAKAAQHQPGEKKSAPTPSRKAAEAARRERINPPLDTKQAKAKARAKAQAERSQNLQRVHEIEVFRLMRNYIDAKFHISEISVPLMLVLLALSLASQYLSRTVIEYSVYVTWFIFAIIIGDIVWMWIGFKKLVAERMPKAPIGGTFMYGMNRMLAPRRLRRPLPEIKRGESF